MTYTRLNPDITSGTPTAANTHVDVGTVWWYKYGRVVMACVNIRDNSPSSGSQLLNGFPPPAQAVMAAIAGANGNAGRVTLNTSGTLTWDSSSYSSGWSNTTFSYLSAT